MFEMLPQELKAQRQWVCVKADSKAPMRAYENSAASSTDRNTWSTYDTAVWAVENGYYDNIGYCFNNSGIVGIDIDTGYSGTELSDEARYVIESCHSYTEHSRSGRGFHILLKGTLPYDGKNNRKGMEIYRYGRYFIMTGNTYLYTEIIENQQAIDAVLNKYFREETIPSAQNINHLPKIYNPVWKVPSPKHIPLSPEYPEIKQGCRNVSMLSLAGAMLQAGYRYDNILEELYRVNDTVCNPPLSKAEIKQVLNSASRYER